MSLISIYKKSSQFHEREKLIRLGTSLLGKILIVVLAYFLIPSHSPQLDLKFFPPRPIFITFLVFFMIAPKFRTSILSIATLYLLYAMLRKRMLFDLSFNKWLSLFAAIAFFCIIFYLCYRAAKIFERLPRLIRKYPQIHLHAVFWIAVLAGFYFFGPSFIPNSDLGVFPWLVLVSLPYVVWRIGFLLISGKRGSAKTTRFRDHLFYLWPIYQGSYILPMGKGYDYLSPNASKDEESRAKSQLAGIRLLMLAKIWWITQILLVAFIYGDFKSWIPDIFHSFHLELPRIGVLISSFAQPGFSRLDGWISVVIALVNETLSICILGHGMVGCLRLFGFYVFRNTYKPLLSQTILEFWNRYFYYYKELLVEFFFYPTYLSYFKSRPRLRIFAAIMAAAFLGNVYFHVFEITYIRTLASMDFQGAFSYVAPRVFYSFLLALGIYVSFLREKKRQGKTWETGTWLSRIHALKRISFVILFIAIIRIWVEGDANIDFTQRLNFFLWLVGFG